MKFLVLGCGSIGTRHATNLKKLGIDNIILCDLDLVKAKKLGKKVGSLDIFTDYEIATNKHPNIDAALICIPTSLHIEPAIFFAKKKINLFIEKPLSHNLKNLKVLDNHVKKNNLIAMMGHVYLFEEGFLTLKSLLEKNTIGKIHHVSYLQGMYLPDWHPKMDYKTEYSARKDLGGGALLTLTSHSFYVLEWIVDKIKSIHGSWIGTLGNLEIDVHDSAFFLFETNSGIIIESHNDFIVKVHHHKLIIEGEIYRLMKKNVVIYKQRLDCLCELLTEHFKNIAYWKTPSGGLTIWLQFNPKISLVKLAREAEKNNLFLPKTILYQDKNTCAIRFGFGHLNTAEIAAVIQKLKNAYHKVTLKKSEH